MYRYTFSRLQTDGLAVRTVTSLAECFHASHVAGVKVKSFNRTDRLLAAEYFLEMENMETIVDNKLPERTESR